MFAAKTQQGKSGQRCREMHGSRLGYTCARAGTEFGRCFAKAVPPFGVVLARNGAGRDIVRNRYGLVEFLPPD